jgi:hypothetical protein
LSQLAREEIERLTAALQAHDYLARIVREIERSHRVVFHDNKRVDWDLVRRSAEQILIAELVCRYQGRAEGVYFALRALEDGGQKWDAALRGLAAAIHSYFTTPLGMVMRQDLFGSDAVFITPDAHTWTAQLKGRPATNDTGVS